MPIILGIEGVPGVCLGPDPKGFIVADLMASIQFINDVAHLKKLVLELLHHLLVLADLLLLQKDLDAVTL